MDLGSGDGRTVITAAKRGARATGIEFNPDMVALSRRNAAAAGVGDKATFVQGDIFKTDFTKATVITLFLLPDLNLRLRPQLLDMKPGTRVVSNSFDMGEVDSGRRGLGSGRLHQLLPRHAVDHPGQGARKLADARRRTGPDSDVPEPVRHA